MTIDNANNVHVAWVDNSGLGGSGTDNDIYYKYLDATTGIWSPAEVVSTESTGNSDCPAIVVDGYRNVHLAWQDNTNYQGSGSDYDILYKVRNALTGTWGTAEVVSSESTADSKHPSIAVDSSGNVHIAWDDYTNYGGHNDNVLDIFYKWRNVATNTWSSVSIISLDNTFEATTPNLFIDQLNTIHMVYRDGYSFIGNSWYGAYRSKTVQSYTWSSKSWIYMSNFDFRDVINPSIIVDGLGNKHIVCFQWSWTPGISEERVILFYQRYDKIANSWCQPFDLGYLGGLKEMTNDYIAIKPSIAIDKDNNLHVAWNENGTIFERWMNQSIPNCQYTGWSSKDLISTNPVDPASNPIVAASASGCLHVIWDNNTRAEGYNALWYQCGAAPYSKIYHASAALSGNPVPNFIANATYIEPGNAVQFNFTGYGGMAPSTFQWNFGNGAGNSTDRDPIYAFSTPGNYSVTLVVTDNSNKRGTITKANFISVSVNLPPAANFTINPTSPVDGQQIQFTDTSVDLDGTVVGWQWNFGDFTANSTARNPTHVYNLPGTHMTTLTVIDDRGKFGTRVMNITVVAQNTPPMAVFIFGPVSPVVGQSVVFSDLSTDFDGVIVSREWSFGDGTANATSQNSAHVYSIPGTFTVTLTIIDDDGASDTFQYNITIAETDPSGTSKSIGQGVSIILASALFCAGIVSIIVMRKRRGHLDSIVE
nr:PKD domain-containing protein [Candidatus Sigynarchaeota archaeon]